MKKLIYFNIVFFFILFHEKLHKIEELISTTTLSLYEISEICKGKTEEEYTKSAKEIVRAISESKLNTVFFQARCFSDALYKSSVFPSSRYIAEKEGAEISFDPLKIFIELAAENNIAVHAWINPLRISYTTDISELSELEIPKYAPIFMCVGELFGDYVGVYFKLVIDEEEYILQRRDDLFVLYQVHERNEVSYEMFTVDEEYKVTSAGFDDFEMHTVSGDRVVQRRDSNNIESLIFMKRKDGGDVDGYDGSVGYIQYNQEHDVRLMLIFQQMYNYQEKVYGYHVGKSPFQILI